MASAQPLRSGHTQGKGAYGIGEGNGEPHVSDVEQRWVDRHQNVVLKKRIRSRPVKRSVDGGKRPGTRSETPILCRFDTHLEWVGDGEHQAKEEDAHPTDHGKGGGTQPVRRSAVASGNDPREHGQDQPPKKDGALQRRPGCGDIEWKRCSGCVVVGDIRKREIVG